MLVSPPMVRGASLVYLVGALGALGRVAQADGTAPEPIELIYSAPSGCPDAEAFFAGIRARANAVRAAHGDRTFRVAITLDEAGAARGTLEVAAADGTTTTREVADATCADTVTALALVAALAIEERAVHTPPPVASPSVPWGLAVGAGVARYTGIAPGGAFGVAAYAAAGHGHVQLRLGFARSERVDVDMPAGSVDFRWTVGRLDACPYVLAAGRFDAAACAGLEAGVLTGRGTQVGMPNDDSRPWLAPDGAVRLAAHIGRAAVEVEGLIAAPVVRDRFFIAPSTTVHQVPAITTGVSISLGVDVW